MGIVGEQRPDRPFVTAGVEGLLDLVDPPQQLDSLGSIHDLADEGAKRAEMDLLFQEAESPGP
jgi:hypothetical protein